MDEPTDDDKQADVTRTTIEIDSEVWRQVRSRGVAEGKQVSEMLEEILRDYFDMEEGEKA
ncbi:hypothetical protein ACEU6E_05330 [Halorutilales archaeon Cl-col2-1]